MSDEQTTIQYNPANWMSDPAVRSSRLCDLTLPGTHDSATAALDFSKTKDIWTERGTGRLFLMTLVGWMASIPFIGGIIKKWATTQERSIKEQLESGVRAFDFRVAYNQKTGDIECSHTFPCSPSFKEQLQELRGFLDEHPGEVVVVKIKPDYIHRSGMQGHHKDVIDAVNEVLGDVLCPRKERFDEKSMTVDRMVKKNQRVVCIYGGCADKQIYGAAETKAQKAARKKIWPASSFFRGQWFNRDNQPGWENEFKQYCKKGKPNPKYCSGVDAVLTPRKSTFRAHLWRNFIPFVPSRALQHMADRMKGLYRKICGDVHSNIVFTDFADSGSIAPIIYHSIEQARHRAGGSLCDDEVSSGVTPSPGKPRAGHMVSTPRRGMRFSSKRSSSTRKAKAKAKTPTSTLR